MLGLEVKGHDHMPDEKATVGLIDTKSYKFEKLTQTNAWNYQQGTMLHWNPLNPDTVSPILTGEMTKK